MSLDDVIPILLNKLILCEEDKVLPIGLLRLSETCKRYRKSNFKESLLRWSSAFPPPPRKREFDWYSHEAQVSGGVHFLNPRYEPIDFGNEAHGKVWCSTVQDMIWDYTFLSGYGYDNNDDSDYDEDAWDALWDDERSVFFCSTTHFGD
jgi:hypothetical protein